MVKVETKKTENLQGKEQLGIIISNGDDKVVIVVGEKTHAAVEKLVSKETKQK